jgi:hypothetical protein
MKQIDYYIESNMKKLEELIEEFENTDANDQRELQRIRIKIESFKYYIKGLEDAKKYILEEVK